MNFFFFSNTTHRIDFFFDKNDSKNWTFFSCDAKNWTFFLFASKNWCFFLNVTRTFLFLQYDSKNWTFFCMALNFNMTQRIEQLFMTHRIERLFEYDTKNWISFWGWFKESNSFLNTTFLNTTQWIEPSLTWLEDLIFFLKKKEWLKELSFSQKYDTKNWTFFRYDSIFFFQNMTRRI